jgi:chromosome partitioning protein
VSGEVVRQFGETRVLVPIRSDIRLAEAFTAGKPIRWYAPRSRGALDFAELGQHVLTVLASMTPLDLPPMQEKNDE